MQKKTVEIIYDDYAQSANTLFHFMKKMQYLKEILQKKAIVPRYCKEDLEYLKICNNDILFAEAFVLQKCFCDIPFHKLTESFQLKGTGKNYDKLSKEEKAKLPKNFTHTDFYGEYAIAFSKNWGEKNSLQPVHYLNQESEYTKYFSNLIGSILMADNVPELYAENILNRLCLVKPLRGIMKRKFKCENGDEVEIEFQKNFHDEQEWRYIPKSEAVIEAKMERVIANPNILRMSETGVDINTRLNTETYSILWLKYCYEDIRYIVVPDANARIDIIKEIVSIPEHKFNSQSDIAMQKNILVSKILVWEEIKKDW